MVSLWKAPNKTKPTRANPSSPHDAIIINIIIILNSIIIVSASASSSLSLEAMHANVEIDINLQIDDNIWNVICYLLSLLLIVIVSFVMTEITMIS